ncbi:DNA-directed RNA polymerase subunit beta' [Candidatus Parcubacteria bacterium]|nr:MAG: DNA-directed RNA polymerase subunit beta' [Candidatus Parcubacteria bacterium]
MQEPTKIIEFNALRLTLASPVNIKEWSFGEVLKPETVNYRTQKPEKDGLFCERIFGPSKDWECYCGKYKKIRYKGIICDKCGVEVTRSIVRRERMGHINLAVPCSHIWFLRGVPSKIGLMLDLSPQALEKVIYFANFIITNVNEDLKKDTLEQIKQEFKSKKKRIESDFQQQAVAAKKKILSDTKAKNISLQDSLIEQESKKLEERKKEKIKELEKVLQIAETELKDLKPLKIISEHIYQDLSIKYGHLFDAGIGAEAIRQLLEEIDLEKLNSELKEVLKNSRGPVREKTQKRLRLVNNLKKNKLRPEWMILTIVPVIPPDLRPMVPLDGGRFATSDLNDLYRRIINRNNRLKQLKELNAPEVICRNEKRMLQEAVDALIDNSARHGKTVVASTGQKRMLKSLADILKGKQGRFRQNLLGKRIDYSGRSVIVIGPKLRIDQCGIPKKMALELFKPFIISQLIKLEHVHNVRSASRMIEAGKEEVWDILEEVVKGSHVMLNRAPTLHRLGIQAFKPVLIEGKAIQIHPLVCDAFNADFDGDQMAVHVPLTEQAKWEAANIMISSRNLLKPATGDPITVPTKDMVWGIYYMTQPDISKARPKAVSKSEALFAVQLKQLKLQREILINKKEINKTIEPKEDKEAVFVKTTAGRLIFNEILPPEFPYYNKLIDGKTLRSIVGLLLERFGQEKTAILLDNIKGLGLKYLTLSGFSWGMDDIPDLEEKKNIIAQADKEVSDISEQYENGLLTDSERHSKIIEIWMSAKDKIVEISKNSLKAEGPIYTMVESGARGSWGQLIQIMGMKGLVTNPAGEIIELPVKGNFKEGFDVLEYFISTHGARKGLSDTALRTANAGYLTRRLVDVAQDLVISEEDCKDSEGNIITKKESDEIGKPLADRVLGRYVMEDVKKGNKVIIKKGEVINRETAEKIKAMDLAELKVRSVITCKTYKGICKKCYGYDLAYNKPVELGVAVGIIAAQSIGEPGTQLTMRTFHTGGVAGLDITQGLPRVEEIFECRTPKNKATLAEVDGKVEIELPKSAGKNKIIKIAYKDIEKDHYLFADKAKLEVKDGDKVKKASVLFTAPEGEKVVAKRDGKVKLEEKELVIYVELEKKKEYLIPPEFNVLVSAGDLVVKGTILTDGSLDLQQLFKLSGKEATQKYILKEIQRIYSSQGQKLNDKHIELITRQMFSRYLVKSAGSTDLLPGERVEKSELLEANDKAKKTGNKEATGEELLLGITKVSLSTSSFLSAASFQETARVLINAAVAGRIDKLEGLKENVIIGRLIPAGTGFKKE